jgi:hypothetical protein
MQKVNRRSAVALGLAAASAAMVKPAASQTTDIVGKDATPWPGVVVRVYGETPAIIPGFKNVQLRDIIMQPGSKTMGPPMMNAMVCHITEGELRIEQEGKTFTAKKNFVWTCNKDTKEQAYNDGNAVGIMRITDLMAWLRPAEAASVGGLFHFSQASNVAYGHIASFRCDAESGRYRGIADIEQAVPIKFDLW